MRYGYGDHMHGGGWVLMGLIVLLVAAGVIALMWFVRSQGQSGQTAASADVGGSARDLLDRRLVTGEITEEDYRRLRAALGDASPPAQPAAPG